MQSTTTTSSSSGQLVKGHAKALNSPNDTRDASAPGSPAVLKAVIRRMPPNLAEPQLREVLDRFIKEAVFFYFVAADRRLGDLAFSRAYIAFESAEILTQFIQQFDRHIFRDAKGNEHEALVELAPFQKLPKRRVKMDPKQGTLDKDQDYKQFLAQLEQSSSVQHNKTPEVNDANEAPPKQPSITPLVEFLHAKLTAKAAAKEKRRQKDREKKQQIKGKTVHKVIASTIPNASVATFTKSAGPSGETEKDLKKDKDRTRAKRAKAKAKEKAVSKDRTNAPNHPTKLLSRHVDTAISRQDNVKGDAPLVQNHSRQDDSAQKSKLVRNTMKPMSTSSPSPTVTVKVVTRERPVKEKT